MRSDRYIETNPNEVDESINVLISKVRLIVEGLKSEIFRIDSGLKQENQTLKSSF